MKAILALALILAGCTATIGDRCYSLKSQRRAFGAIAAGAGFAGGASGIATASQGKESDQQNVALAGLAAGVIAAGAAYYADAAASDAEEFCRVSLPPTQSIDPFAEQTKERPY